MSVRLEFASPGWSDVHHGIPSASSAGSQFHLKFWSELTPVAGSSTTGSRPAVRMFGVQCTDPASAAGDAVYGGPGCVTGAYAEADAGRKARDAASATTLRIGPRRPALVIA